MNGLYNPALARVCSRGISPTGEIPVIGEIPRLAE
jgi:hypothetical protein